MYMVIKTVWGVQSAKYEDHPFPQERIKNRVFPKQCHGLLWSVLSLKHGNLHLDKSDVMCGKLGNE
jgi:hypothetical protein